jgi:hypothetical protein
MGQPGWRHVLVGNGIARCGGRVAGRAYAHVAQRHSGNGHREGHTRGGNFVRTPASG